MVYGIYTKISREAQKNEKFITSILQHNVNRERIKNLINGVKLMNFSKIQFGEDGEDFRNNLISVLITCDAYRIPRFLKKSLLNRFKPV